MIILLYEWLVTAAALHPATALHTNMLIMKYNSSCINTFQHILKPYLLVSLAKGADDIIPFKISFENLLNKCQIKLSTP